MTFSENEERIIREKMMGDGVATTADLVAIRGATPSATELGYIDGVTAGTVLANKAVVAGANRHIDALVVSNGGLALGSGAGTAILATANELNILDDCTASAAAINTLKPLPVTFTLTPSAGAENICEVAIVGKKADGATSLTNVAPVLVWLSDAVSGAGLTGTSTTGTVQAKSGSQDLAVLTAKKALLVQLSAAGLYTLEITDSAKTLFKVCVQPLTGGPISTVTLTAENYGSGS
jgi:hypothetical protein